MLFDVDLSARRCLAGVMADPPMNDPVGQLLLLRQAMATHSALWTSVRLIAGRPEFALALGLDLDFGQIPGHYLERLQASFRNFVPHSQLSAAVPPAKFWLSSSPRL